MKHHVLKLFYEFVRVEPNSPCNLKKFNQIHASLPTFAFRHVGLMAAQTVGHILLRQSGIFSSLNQQALKLFVFATQV